MLLNEIFIPSPHNPGKLLKQIGLILAQGRDVEDPNKRRFYTLAKKQYNILAKKYHSGDTDIESLVKLKKQIKGVF